MPFCRVYLGAVDDESNSFKGYFQKLGDTIYAAVDPDSDEFNDYRRSLEVFDVRGGRALYTISYYLSVNGKKHGDIAAYKYNGRYGYVETGNGKVIV